MAEPLTGRIASGPGQLLRTEVLEPQLAFEARHLLAWYVKLEKVLLLEYHRMGLVTGPDVVAIGRLLDQATEADVLADGSDSMTDLVFTVERFVSRRLADPPPTWHVDRSRNDLQASAQLLYGRERILELADLMVAFAQSAHALAVRHVEVVMPGYTHLQPAQVISPGFYLAALIEEVLHAIGGLEHVYRTANVSPMGAGAMAGQELDWDRDRMARLLGCDGVRQHALRAVAARNWPLDTLASLSSFAVTMSRFVTDLMTWGGAGYRFIDLPDEWCGISSAMPQKKNFPVLERLRGRTAHVTAGYLDALMAQRNTSYSNTVEVSKEPTFAVAGAFDAMASVLRLFTGTLERLTFREAEMRAACAGEYLGGFTLANQLTLRCGVPWREAQVMAGRYVVAAVDRGLPPDRPDPELLVELAGPRGHTLGNAGELLDAAFDLDRALETKRSAGSANPDAVRELLATQQVEIDRARRRQRQRRDAVADGLAELDRLMDQATKDCGGSS